MIALVSVLFMKGELVALASFSFIGACLFKMLLKVVSKSSNVAILPNEVFVISIFNKCRRLFRKECPCYTDCHVMVT